MARYAPGIERGKDKWVRIDEGEDFAATVNRSVKQLHEDLPAEIAAKEAELVAAQAKLQTNLDRLAKAREQAKAEGVKAEKALKNAETYERRADTARNDIKNLEGILEGLRKTRSALETENRSLDETLAQKKTNVSGLRAKKAALEARLRALNAA
jgi:chromosome segregation ATPase